MPQSGVEEAMANLQVKDEKYYASIDENHDGMWLADGFLGMMIHLDSEDFLEEESLEFEADQEIDENLKFEREFLFFNLGNLEKLEQMGQTLRTRQLSLTACIRRRLVEGMCPPRIRIRRMRELERKEILEIKRKGNEAFAAKKYEEALECYDDATLLFPTYMFVAPQQDMKELVIILSNMAECHLRLKQYNEAGQIATEALMFDSEHEKSRIRRAKAELALLSLKEKSPVSLIQASGGGFELYGIQCSWNQYCSQALG
jgi:tetratricopeptide (TPR) repeat protein